MNKSGRSLANPLAIGSRTCELMATLPVLTTSKFMAGKRSRSITSR